MKDKGKEDKARGVFERPKGSGVYWIHWYDHVGKRHRQKIGTFAEAKRRRGEVKSIVHRVKKKLEHPSALVEAGYLDRSHLGLGTDLTLRDFIKDCLPELKQNRTWKDQERFAKTWVRLIGDSKLVDVEAKHAVKRRTARLERGIAPATCNREVEFLRSLLNKAVRDGHLQVNPLSKLKDLPEDNKRIRWLRFEEEERIQTQLSQEDFEIVAFAMDMGLRRSKVFGLAWRDVHFEGQGWVDVKDAKAGSSRQVPIMTDRVRDLLERRKANQKGPWVFPSTARHPKGQGESQGERQWERHLNGDGFCKRKFRPAVRRAEVLDFKFHDLRHTFCSRLVMAGVPLRTVMELAGHKNFQTTLRYAHLAPESFTAASSSLNEYNRARRHLRVINQR